MSSKVNYLVEHYNRTSDITGRFWLQRNATFLILVLVIAAAALLTSPETMNLLATALLGAANLDRGEREAIRTGLPYTAIHIAFMVTMFYLMVTLYHRHASIVRNFVYLGLLEAEIRRELGVAQEDIAFTRESSFYFSQQSLILRMMKALYILILGGLLAAYFFLRVTNDIEGDNFVLLVVDIVLGAALLMVFIGYAFLRKPKRGRAPVGL